MGKPVKLIPTISSHIHAKPCTKPKTCQCPLNRSNGMLSRSFLTHQNQISHFSNQGRLVHVQNARSRDILATPPSKGARCVPEKKQDWCFCISCFPSQSNPLFNTTGSLKGPGNVAQRDWDLSIPKALGSILTTTELGM